jgi:hypothetical protein
MRGSVRRKPQTREEAVVLALVAYADLTFNGLIARQMAEQGLRPAPAA